MTAQTATKSTKKTDASHETRNGGNGADDFGTMNLPGVYKAIASVMEDVGREGIAKERKNQQQGYNFRGIDDVYNALAPILARHHLIIVPRVLSREKTEQTTQKGNLLFYVVVQVEFDIVCALDGSKITACTWGEAMDSADKATNKAMSAAYKYMAMQTFCIPTEGDNDADATSHEVVRTNAGSSAPQRKAQQATGGEAPPASPPVQPMSKANARPDFTAMIEEIRACQSLAEVKDWGRRNVDRIKLQPTDWVPEIRKEYADMVAGFEHLARAAEEADRAFAEERR